MEATVFSTPPHGLTKPEALWYVGIETMKRFQKDQLWGDITFRYRNGELSEVRLEQHMK